MTKSISREVLLVAGILIITVIVSLVSLRSAAGNTKNLLLAEVVEIGSIDNDGGFFYQNLSAQITGQESKFPLRVRLQDPNFEKIRTGDPIYVREVNSQINNSETPSYIFSGFSKGNILLWIVILFLAFVVVMLGLAGLKYVLPTIMMLILIISGYLSQALTINNGYVFAFGILVVISFTSILVQVRNVRIALIVSISQIITLALILLINLVLFEKMLITGLYYVNANSMEIDFSNYWNLLNISVIFVSFGGIINTTLDVAKGIVDHKRSLPGISTFKLIKEGTLHHQLAVARVINAFFFVFLGLVLTSIVFYDQNKYLYFWDDPKVIYLLLLFINSATAAIIVGPITAIVTAIFLNAAASKSSDQYQLK